MLGTQSYVRPLQEEEWLVITESFTPDPNDSSFNCGLFLCVWGGDMPRHECGGLRESW